MTNHRLQFLQLFIPAFLVVVGGGWLYGKAEINWQLTSNLISRDTINVGRGAGALSGTVAALTRDLKFLASHSALRAATNDLRPETRAHLEEDFANFVSSKQIYDQLRWIDETGMEIVRVDFNKNHAVIIATDKLQNKGKRYFFTDSFKLTPGEVFISPLDLNVEQNAVEIPYKPMLRLATPVVDKQGAKRGIVILNYYGKELLQAFSNATSGISDHVMVVNSDGYWLKSPRAEDEWGFMFKKPELSLAARAPEAWKQISAKNEGQITLADGVWTWQTVHPLLASQKSSTGAAEAFAMSRGEVKADQYEWKVIAHLPPERIAAVSQEVWRRIALIGTVLLCLFGFGSYKLAKRTTELAAATKKIKDAELRYRTIADFTFNWEIWVAPDGQWLYCSPSCLAITGYGADQFISQPKLFFEILHPESRSKMTKHFNQASIEELSDAVLEFSLICADGNIKWLEHACRPVHDAEGNYLGRRASNRDVTARKQTETELINAREAAEAASHAKSTFLANMSHELRTPMNGIMGMVSMALRHAADPKLRHQLETIDHSSHHLLGVINDILDISKIEAGRLSLEQVNFKFGDVLHNLGNLIGGKAAEKQLSLRFDIAPELQALELCGDPLRLGQILLNLAGNAIKFTEQGTITVKVRHVELDADQVRLHCVVSDTGIGIGADQLGRLFTAFEQADSSMTRKYGGTGLGLVICKRLVQMMGGEISVESTPNQGSTFGFDVALAKGIQIQPSKISQTLPADLVLQNKYAGTPVLLAEDEPVNQEISRMLLEDVGLKVDVANDGAEALALARQKRYAMILLDMQMPNLSGIDATRAIRLDSINSDTPIMAMTANAFEEDRQACLEAGMNDHVGKPVDPDVLYAKLLALLEQGHS